MCFKSHIIIFFILFLTACDLIDYHPYDGLFYAETSQGVNVANIDRIEKYCAE